MGIRLNRLAEAVLTCTHNLCFEQKSENNQKNSTESFQFLQLKKSLYITRACFRNVKVTEWPPFGKIAAHSAYDMFHGISTWLLVCFFPTSVFGMGIFF